MDYPPHLPMGHRSAVGDESDIRQEGSAEGEHRPHCRCHAEEAIAMTAMDRVPGVCLARAALACLSRLQAEPQQHLCFRRADAGEGDDALVLLDRCRCPLSWETPLCPLQPQPRGVPKRIEG